MSVKWVSHLGVSVIGVFYRGVDLGVSIVRDVFFLSRVSIIGSLLIIKKNTIKLLNS